MERATESTVTAATASVDAARSPLAAAGSWSLSRRIAFRWGAVYFVLYAFPFPLGYLPWVGGYLSLVVDRGWKSTAPWVAAEVLGIERELYLGPTGSGDTTLAYVMLFMMVVLSTVVALSWSLLDRRRPHYRRLARWLLGLSSYYLGTVMLGYGIAKVIPTQFSQPALTRFLQPWGDSSPMGVVWTFMGLSPVYTIFSGMGEVVGGLLVFFRRTRTLGALILVVVMTNVVMLNFSYDVPVKLFSSHLLLIAVALAWVDRQRIIAVFLRNRSAPPADQRLPFIGRRANLVLRVLALSLVAYVVFANVRGTWANYSHFGNARPKPSIWGIFDVERFLVAGEEIPPLLTDELRWRALVVDRVLPIDLGYFQRPGSISVWHMDGGISSHPVELDETTATLSLLPDGHQSVAAAAEAEVEIEEVLLYERPQPDRLLVRGTWQGKEIEVHLRERDLAAMELTGRGFHWINELPRNR